MSSPDSPLARSGDGGTAPLRVSEAPAWCVTDVSETDPQEVIALFRALSQEPHFSPHPFDEETVALISGLRGRDRYLVGRLKPGGLVAYGLLRGWDAGYQTPSLGLAVHPSARGRGIGALMMVTLHNEALRSGASAVRLRVHPDNHSAIGLYGRFGYTLCGEERGQMVLTRRIP